MKPSSLIQVLVCAAVLLTGSPATGQTGAAEILGGEGSIGGRIVPGVEAAGDGEESSDADESSDGGRSSGGGYPSDSGRSSGGGESSGDEQVSGDLISNLQRSLDIIESGLERDSLNSEEIDAIRRQLDFVADTALRARAGAARRAEEQSRLLSVLGPKPGESEPPETETVVSERQRLEDSIAEHKGAVKAANVVLARVEALRNRLAREEFGNLAKVLVQWTEIPLAPGTITGAFVEMPIQWKKFRAHFAEWRTNVEFDRKRVGTLTWWLVLLVVVIAVVVTTRNWVLRRHGPDYREESPSFTRRFRVMLAVGLGNVVLPVVSIAGLYIVLLKSAALTAELNYMVWIVTITLCQYFVVTGLSAAALSPRYPNWRISRFTNDSAVGLYRGIRVFAVIVVVLNLVSIPLIEPQESRGFSEMLVVDVMRDSLHTLFGVIVTVVISLAMLNILRAGNWQFLDVDDDGQSVTVPPGKLVRVFFMAARLGLFIAVAAALIGFVNLGLFLAQRIVWSLLLVAFALLLRAFIAATCNQAVGQESDVGSLLRDKLGYSSSGAARLLFWVLLLVDIMLSVGVLVVLLLLWGVQSADILNTAGKLVYGISIGDYTLSLIDVGVALGIFIVLLVAVRLFQGFLSNRVLAQTVPDVGVRDALTTGVGYTGVIIAVFIAISSLGLELSQLAIVLGALSVGIGFGLQHVANNFISGLILLMQRPIKAGDWIVVGQHEGYVRKINVVSTELQTFDNAEVIVPNSQLVSSEVMNWTHTSTVARVIVAVRVSHEADPEQVRKVLLRCADENSDVLRTPAPVVVFRNFGESALEFELRFFIREADYMLLIGSDLRFAIIAAFREAGITIPYPQRDIHIRTSAGSVDADHEARGGSSDTGESRSRESRRPKGESEEDPDTQ